MLSSKARYGLRAMAVLGRSFRDGELVAVEHIAREQEIPVKFLEATLTELRKRGLLRSRRGPAGGYALTRAPQEISLAEIIRTLDGPFAPTPCARTKEPQQCDGCADMDTCTVRPMMREVRDAMAAVLERQTVADLMKQGARHAGRKVR
ncbi:MAG: Rrf2 family transcriptional regulator [Candidatus Hydrogenedens sp.]|nr:Rrf2 family transcriptional regulator [Candidatus Hydrogenedens sp.]